MFADKKPSKWIVLTLLLIAVLIGLLMFFGLRAEASGAPKNFLPIREITTPGGLSVWLVEDHTLPIVAVKYMFRDSGSALDPEDKQGMARMLSNTMDEGAGDMDSQSFQKALGDSSIELSFDAGRDSFGGDLKTLSRNEDKAFDLLALALNKPKFDTEAVARMRDANITRIKSNLSEPRWMAARLINDKAFSGAAYAKNSGGTIGDLAKITPDDLRAFKSSYLTRDRLLIAVSGDITPEKIGPALDRVFGGLPAKASGTARVADTAVANAGKTFLYKQEIPQTMVEAMLPAFDHRDKDYYALQVMNYIYGGAGFGSRLMETAREKGGLTYGIYTSLEDYRHADALTISTSTKTESTAEMLAIIKNEMGKMTAAPVSAKELADAKSFITGSMPLALDSTEAVAAIMLSLREDDLPIDYLDHFAQHINDVSAQDVSRVAARVLKPAGMVTVLVGNPANLTGAEPVKELPNVQ